MRHPHLWATGRRYAANTTTLRAENAHPNLVCCPQPVHRGTRHWAQTRFLRSASGLHTTPPRTPRPGTTPLAIATRHNLSHSKSPTRRLTPGRTIRYSRFIRTERTGDQMATSKNSAAEKAASAYRAALVENSVETLVGDLAVKMGEWKLAREARERGQRELIAREEATENAVAAAYEAAREGGAKVSALEKIDLKPTAALAAVSKRAKAGKEKGNIASPSTPTSPPTPVASGTNPAH